MQDQYCININYWQYFANCGSITSIVIAKILKPVARGAVRYIYKYKLMVCFFHLIHI